VHVGLKNPRSAEVERIAFRPPDLPWVLQPTALEARHFCATYALHRVCSMKNIQHMLPPTHKRFWSAWEDVRAEEKAAGKAWRYEADPFAVKREHELARAKQEQKREAQQQSETTKKFKDSKLSLSGGKGWQAVPVVDMSRDRRFETEGLIRRYHVWNPLGVAMSKGARRKIVEELAALGFRKLHVEEACDWARDREEALEWLLTHVPEDEVPPRFLPENNAAGITMSTGESLGVEYATKRLAAMGYSLDLCREVLERNALDEHRAAEALMQMLVHGKQSSPIGVVEVDAPAAEHHDWEEEMASLEAIYGSERFKCVSPSVTRITLDMQDQGPKNLPAIVLEIRKPVEYSGSMHYPEAVPTFAVFMGGERKLPAHVRLSIVRQTAEYAETLKGEQMVFAVVDWLENEILRIVDNPGRLRDVATAITGSDERKDEPSVQQKRRRKPCRKGPINWTPGTKQSLDILQATEARLNTPAQKKMIEVRMRLPAWETRHDIVKAVNEAQVVIISGETGSGKSTQSVQFVLDDIIQRKLGATANIVCTQPRRISALGLADRVSDERCQTVGQEIGYAIRGEAKQTPGVTKVVFVTTGVLLRRLQMGDTLEDISHIVVDEVHERSLDTDFLLILLKRIITKRKDLKIILMSATLDADVFSDYFGGDKAVRRINIEGRTFPVKDIYLDTIIKATGFTGGGMSAGRRDGKKLDDPDWDDADPSTSMIIRSLGDRINYSLIAATVTEIDKQFGDTEGAILIFLPGKSPFSGRYGPERC